MATARSWRGVLRAMGMNDSSAGSLRAAQRRAHCLGIPYNHFTGQRRWSDDELRNALPDAASWSALAVALGRTPDGGTLSSLRTRALRLRLPIAHLEPRRPEPDQLPAADMSRLPVAAPMLAAAWFAFHGFNICWPLEPARYDLLVEREATVRRVQVKTTTWRDAGAYSVAVSSSRVNGRASYSVDEIDCFFVVDGELNAYLVPASIVAGFQRLSLSAYADFKVMNRGLLLPAP
jgi:PD-(D/E)XK endonuclease